MVDNTRGTLIRGPLPWLALGIALSVPLVNLASSLDGVPFAASLLIAPLLVLRLIALRRPGARDAASAIDSPRRPLPTLPGLLLLAAAIAIQLVGVIGDAWSIAWLSVPMAIVGMSLWTRALDPRLALLSFWIIPIPTTLFIASTPWAEVSLGQIAALPIRLFAPDLELSGPLVRFADRDLPLRSLDNGVHVAWLLTLLLWYAMLRRGADLIWFMKRAPAIVPLAIFLQIGSIQIAMLLLITNAPLSGEPWLAIGGWVCIALAGMVWVERARD